jgi:hypothetical protein
MSRFFAITMLIILYRCSLLQNYQQSLLYTDNIIISNEKYEFSNKVIILSSERFVYQKCYKNNIFYSNSIYVNFFEFANQLKMKYPEAHGIKDLEVLETNSVIENNVFYRIFFIETCILYSGTPIKLSNY